MAAPAPKLADRFSQTHSKQSLRLWLSILNCSTVIEKEIRSFLAREFDTTLPRFDVLAALDRYSDGLSMGELSGHLLVSNGNVTGLVARLQEDGLVERNVSPVDRRTFRVRLTDAGRRSFVKMAAAHEAFVDALLSDLGDREIADLLTRLHRIQDRLDAKLAREEDA